MADAIDELQAHGVYDDCELDADPRSDFDRVTCDFAIALTSLKPDSTVYVLAFSPSTPITVEQALATLGPPRCVFVLSPLLPDHPSTSAQLLFDDPPATLALESQSAAIYTIHPSTSVWEVIYWQAGARTDPLGCAEWAGYSQYFPSP